MRSPCLGAGGGLLGALGALLVLLGDGLAHGRHHAALGDGHVLEQLAEVVVVADGEGQGAGRQAAHLLAALRRGLHGKLKNLRDDILQYRSKVGGARGTHAAGVLSAAEERAHAADGEDQTGLGGLGAARLAGSLLSGAGSGHWKKRWKVCGERVKPKPRWKKKGCVWWGRERERR
ncbi:histone H2A [Angomonas deanei]|uniref:Uncharacterized protein n=1 Tax=Angomonas deanei TaxID=59799 RepID=A0A7G2CQZ2_9TRYP|nr:histone H2A [Angomonas deanei]CAD2221799.1 hypothetical protein, conserved [Angomonas deanei]|eukprot:EPY41412.1 histone H2A [Angomonas deanei]